MIFWGQQVAAPTPQSPPGTFRCLVERHWESHRPGGIVADRKIHEDSDNFHGK